MYCVLHVTDTEGMRMENRLAHRGLADRRLAHRDLAHSGLVSDPTRFNSVRGVWLGDVYIYVYMYVCVYIYSVALVAGA